MMPGVQELKQCRWTLVQKKHTSVILPINSFICHFHTFCIDQCMFCLQMPPLFSDYKKNFLFERIKIGDESIKLIGYER